MKTAMTEHQQMAQNICIVRTYLCTEYIIPDFVHIRGFLVQAQNNSCVHVEVQYRIGPGDKLQSVVTDRLAFVVIQLTF